MINYNDPIELTAVYRTRDGKHGPVSEHGGKIAVRWEDIKVVEEYVYTDDWVKFNGPKYCVVLENEADPQPRVILGNYRSMVEHWTNFRRSCPLFVKE